MKQPYSEITGVLMNEAVDGDMEGYMKENEIKGPHALLAHFINRVMKTKLHPSLM